MDLIFLAVVAWFLLHELDAIRQREWRFFFSRVPVGDETAYRVFTALHVPVFLLILVYLPSTIFQIGFDLFMVFHGFLHLVFRNHPAINFDSWFSRVWIYGGSLLGALHVLTVL